MISNKNTENSSIALVIHSNNKFVWMDVIYVCVRFSLVYARARRFLLLCFHSLQATTTIIAKGFHLNDYNLLCKLNLFGKHFLLHDFLFPFSRISSYFDIWQNFKWLLTLFCAYKSDGQQSFTSLSAFQVESIPTLREYRQQFPSGMLLYSFSLVYSWKGPF